MSLPLRQPRIAVLIDGENVDVAYARMILETATRWGVVTVRRVYGRPENTRTKKWLECLTELSVSHRASFGYSAKKNSADIALVIDAMDLIAGSSLGGICVVSSDGDFAHLGLRIREQGVAALAIGKSKPGNLLAWDDFSLLAAKESVEKTQAARASALPSKPSMASVNAARQSLERSEKPQPPTKAFKLLAQAIAGASGPDGWTSFVDLKTGMRKDKLVVSPADYGQENLSQLLRKAGFQVEPIEGQAVRVRKRLQSSRAKA